MVLTYTDNPPVGCIPVDCPVGWYGSKVLSCGETLYLRYDTLCDISYSCDGINWLIAVIVPEPPLFDCGPPFIDGLYTLNMDDITLGCVPGACIFIDVIITS